MVTRFKLACGMLITGCVWTFTGCVSDLDSPSPLKATVDNEITDPAMLEQMQTQAEQSRQEYHEQSVMSDTTQSGVPPVTQYQDEVRPAMFTIPNDQPPVDPQVNVEEPPVQHVNVSGLPTLAGVKVMGSIAAGRDLVKALIQREGEASVICKVGDSILLESDSYTIKTITASGAVVVESDDATHYVIK